MTDRFYKLSGGGNDFIAMIEPDPPPTAETINAWCRRGLSVGADGFFVLQRNPRDPSDPRAARRVEMNYRNADGEPADLCLNGTRCAARLAFELGWDEDESLEIVTPSGSFRAQVDDGTAIAVALPPELGPEAPKPRSIEAEVEGRSYGGHFLNVGVPHFVLSWPPGLAIAPIAELGPLLRRHEVFPGGANVDFVYWVGRHRLELRTFERGVEAETLACGTGVVAAVLVGLSEGTIELPVSIVTAGGFVYRIRDEGGTWFLSGDARIVAEGRFNDHATTCPEPPIWSEP